MRTFLVERFTALTFWLLFSQVKSNTSIPTSSYHLFYLIKICILLKLSKLKRMQNTYFFTQKEKDSNELKLLLVELITNIQPTDKDHGFYDSADVQRLLNVSDKTLYRMRRNKTIPCFKLGKKYYYPKHFFNKKALG
ncbi:helix-turn-helix domain-containing protein [Empedobacter sp.]|uniref:helix-turn-helix domain-containing protein n=1 Tax=Empedobacter sp. TaxID=1927715 RepID=UPI00289DE254|nr:helix-turn-helix domain-containing protein [Empedobacter sp.]